MRAPLIKVALLATTLSLAPERAVQDARTPPSGSRREGASASTGDLDPRFSEHEWIEYVPGTAPLVLAAPHGGSARPSSVADRTSGVLLKDSYTQELAREIGAAFERRAGVRPHIVICHLHRSKLDANRDRAEGAQGDSRALAAWRAWHEFLDDAKARIVTAHGAGLVIDVHGQTHPEEWIEWGYALGRPELAREDDELTTELLARQSSVHALALRHGRELAPLLRGPMSLGGLAESLGYKCVPSPAHPHPGAAEYFDGGYNTRRHGSRAGGEIDAIQMEVPRRLRTDIRLRQSFAGDTADALERFLSHWYGFVPSKKPSKKPSVSSGDQRSPVGPGVNDDK